MDLEQGLTFAMFKANIENDPDMQDLNEELNNIIVEDELDTCSITAVNSDSGNDLGIEVEPPCIYHPTFEEFMKSPKEREKQFEKMRQSLTFAMFKKKIADEGLWRSWGLLLFQGHKEDMSRLMYMGEHS
ncbi:Hypothetical predicted protein [Paramuricea clavata]|uniref:Uncharacterized protein n=1 Tax=Paramuricea clavata TaxID=317549 RepID=A0A6S7FQR8_PARCT|nr:Hypothetical predicted protein [Paramuricea clavata]